MYLVLHGLRDRQNYRPGFKPLGYPGFGYCLRLRTSLVCSPFLSEKGNLGGLFAQVSILAALFPLEGVNGGCGEMLVMVKLFGSFPFWSISCLPASAPHEALPISYWSFISINAIDIPPIPLHILFLLYRK